MSDRYDFLIVGSGPSGCVLASRLARSAAKPKVLLLEAGGKNGNIQHEVSGERFFTHATAEGYNWGYETVPQQQLKGQKINYSRGRGLGGTSAINFTVYTRGSTDDYDEWARRVDDEAWSWKEVNRKFNKLETYHVNGSQDMKRYVRPSHSAHGHDGPLRIGYEGGLERGMTDLLEGAEQAGLPLNLDLNSGNPIGFGIPAHTAYNSQRITAAGAFLADKPDNLTVVTNAPVMNILFDGTKAIGVKSTDKTYFTSNDVILSAGALDTPKILLLSGVGPATELQDLGIPVRQDLPAVGRNLRDHCLAPITILQKPGTNDRAKFFNDPRAMEVAREQWVKDRQGELSHFYTAWMMAFPKSERITKSSEFSALPSSVQEYINKPTVPSYEIASHTPPLWINKDDELKPTDTYLSILSFTMNPQSTGFLRLQSKDPTDKLLIDPQFLSHPFDRRTAVEATRHVMELVETPAMSKDTIRLVGGPKSKSDEDILEYVKTALYSSWHMCGTVKMGKPNESDTGIDKNFRIVGLQGLRVVDMSVVPLIPNHHTQSVAYLIGETAAEKLIGEYSLDLAKEARAAL